MGWFGECRYCTRTALPEIVGVNTPFGRPPGPTPPIEGLRRFRGDNNYVVAFQEPGVADKILAANTEKAFPELAKD